MRKLNQISKKVRGSVRRPFLLFKQQQIAENAVQIQQSEALRKQYIQASRILDGVLDVDGPFKRISNKKSRLEIKGISSLSAQLVRNASKGTIMGSDIDLLSGELNKVIKIVNKAESNQDQVEASFDAANQMINQARQLLASILRTMNEMRNLGTANKHGL